MLAFIGGSGLSRLENMELARRKMVSTPYGEPSGALAVGSIRGRPMVFLARHGDAHTLAPHEVNYRANLWVLKEENVEGIVSVASVGGIRGDLVPGTLVLPDQIIDYTWGRKSTYFEGADSAVTHVDFTEPYCAGLRSRILRAAMHCGERMVDGATYAATQGPRLESAAEITRLERDGAHIVGMTGMPETALARELGLDYAAIAVVVNHAAGRGDSRHGISQTQIDTVLAAAMARVTRIIDRLVGE